MSQKFAGWKAIFTGKDIEAEMLLPLLEQSGIVAQLVSEHGRAFSMRAGDFLESYTIYVLEDRAAEAEAIAEAYLGKDKKE